MKIFFKNKQTNKKNPTKFHSLNCFRSGHVKIKWKKKGESKGGENEVSVI